MLSFCNSAFCIHPVLGSLFIIGIVNSDRAAAIVALKIIWLLDFFGLGSETPVCAAHLSFVTVQFHSSFWLGGLAIPLIRSVNNCIVAVTDGNAGGKQVLAALHAIDNITDNSLHWLTDSSWSSSDWGVCCFSPFDSSYFQLFVMSNTIDSSTRMRTDAAALFVALDIVISCVVEALWIFRHESVNPQELYLFSCVSICSAFRPVKSSTCRTCTICCWLRDSHAFFQSPFQAFHWASAEVLFVDID